MSDLSPIPLPNGWTVRKEWHGHRFRCTFLVNDVPWIVDILLFEATHEVRQEGPRPQASEPGKTRLVAPKVLLYTALSVAELLEAMGMVGQVVQEPPAAVESVVGVYSEPQE